MKDFKNKNIVVTGAGSGLGRHFAIQLYQAGARLALCDIDLDNQETMTAGSRSVPSLDQVCIKDLIPFIYI